MAEEVEAMTDITDEMIEAGALLLRDSYLMSPKAARECATQVLESALAGRTVVDLPQPDGVDDDLGTEWRHDFGSVIVDKFSTIESAQIMRRRAAALLAAANDIERRHARGVAGGGAR